MQLHPDFEKILDAKLRAALEEHVKEKWFPWKTIFAGVIAGLIATAIWASISYLTFKRSDPNVTTIERSEQEHEKAAL